MLLTVVKFEDAMFVTLDSVTLPPEELGRFFLDFIARFHSVVGNLRPVR